MHSKVDIGWATKSLPAEFRLLIECCHANFTQRRGERTDGHQANVDWPRFQALAQRHRVEGLAWHGLRALDIQPPEEIALSLLAAGRQIAEHGLRAAFESERIRDNFASQGMPLLFLKGLAVGHLAYGDAFRKAASDIDILVPAAQIGQAGSWLRELGYKAVDPECDDDATIERWHRVSKESTWVNREDTICLELHSALTDHHDLISGVGIGSPIQNIAIMPGITLATLANDELVAYLCVHGAASAWFRLKWIADLAGLLGGASEAELARLLARARTLGTGRTAEQALLLACYLFPLLPFDASLSRALRRDPIATWLARRSLAQLLAPEPTKRRLGTLTIHLTQLMLAPGLQSAWREFRRQLVHRAHNKRFSGSIEIGR